MRCRAVLTVYDWQNKSITFLQVLVKIATYNLRFGGRANNRVHWQKLIAIASPKILLLQETLPPHEYFPQQKYQALASQIHWHAVDGRKWGSAVYISQGSVTPLAPLSEALAGWVCAVKVDNFGECMPTDKSLYIYSVHAPSVKSSYVKQVNSILDAIQTQAPKNADIVIGGDFNLTVGFRHPSETLQQSQPRIMKRFRRELGLMNCWQMANPNQNLPQTLRWSKDKMSPFHCDGIFTPAAWYRQLESAEVLSNQEWDDLSDHNPVVATFQMGTETQKT